MAFTGKNIKFLQGSYDKLKTLTTSEVGAFYITNDTHEMFLGIDAAKAPVALNRWVEVKDKWSDIQAIIDYKQHPGKIYYAKAENILCTWDGEKWVQINPDTDTDTSLSKVEVSQGQISEENGKKAVKYILTFTQKNISGEDIANPLTADLTITDELVTNLVVNVQVGLNATVSNGIATISTVGTGSDTSKTISITGADGVSVTEKDGKIVVDGTTYTIGANAAKVVLTDSNNESSQVEFIGDDWIEAGTGGTGKIKISHKSPSGEGSKVSTTNGEAKSVASNGTFNALTAIKADNNGHIINAEVTEFTIPNTTYDLQGEYSKIENSEVEYSTVVKIVDGNNNADKVDIKTAHVITVDGTKKIISNGGSLGSFYSAAEIDRQFKALDALTYKGTISDSDDLPTSNVSLGDTYKVNTAFGNYAVGDLLIANGSGEDANGYITGAIVWDHISTGADADTTYTLTGANNKIILTDNINYDTDSIEVNGDSHITATVDENVLNIVHNNVERTNTTGTEIKPAHAASFNVITGVSSNEAGHITGVETTKVTLPGEDSVIVEANNRKFIVKNASNDIKGSIAIEAGEKLDATGVATDGKNLTVTLNHETISTATTDVEASKNVSVTLDGNSSFKVVDSLISDNYGHITGVKTKTISVGKETTYTLTNATVTNNIVTQSLKDNNNDNKGSIKLASNTLTYSVNSGVTNIDILWGSF